MFLPKLPSHPYTGSGSDQKVLAPTGSGSATLCPRDFKIENIVEVRSRLTLYFINPFGGFLNKNILCGFLQYNLTGINTYDTCMGIFRSPLHYSPERW